VGRNISENKQSRTAKKAKCHQPTSLAANRDALAKPLLGSKIPWSISPSNLFGFFVERIEALLPLDVARVMGD